MGFLFRGVRMFLRRLFISKTTPLQLIRLGLFASFSLLFVWIAIMRTTSSFCADVFRSEATLVYEGLVRDASPWKRETPDGGFYQVGDADIYVHSAFYDNRYRSKYIRIFGMQSRQETATVRCKVRTEDGVTALLPTEMSYPIYPKWPSAELLYHAYYYGCGVPDSLNVTDNATLWLLTEGSTVETPVPLTMTRKRARSADSAPRSTAGRRRRRVVVVCVKAMWGDVNASRLIEWLEFNRLLGVDKVVVYDTTIRGVARRVLDAYRRTTFVDVVPFVYALRMSTLMRDDPLRRRAAVDDDETMLEQSYLVSMNDCYHRYRDWADYVSVLDRDEIIVPSGRSSVDELLADAEALGLNASAFLFQTAWHLEEFGVGDRTAPPGLHTQRYTRRSPVMRSQPKAMITSDGAVAINWHGSVTMPTDYGYRGNQYVPWKRLGYVHHYSEHCRYAEAKCQVLAQMVEVDEVIPKYRSALSERVADVFALLNITHPLR